MKKININVIGLGFVGLTTALAFSKLKYKVNAIERNKTSLESLKQNKIKFFEPNLKNILKKANKNNQIIFSSSFGFDEKKINIFFICVGTPANKNGSTNLNQIILFLKQFKKKIDKKTKFYIVIKSTVPPGSILSFKKMFMDYSNVKFISNPEFLREGHAWKDFFNSGKIIIGTQDNDSKIIMKKIYSKLNDKILFMSENSAEFSKYLSNLFLSNLISFSNSMMIFAEKFGGIDVKKSFLSLKMDSRFTGNLPKITEYIHPGLGYGGYCLPKDTLALAYMMKKTNKNNLLSTISSINRETFLYQLNKILKNSRKNIFILGASFKPNSDDIRFSKSIDLVKILQRNKKKNIFVSDPKCYDSIKNLFEKNVKILKKPKKIKNTTYVLATAWKEYIQFSKKLEISDLIDLRYIV